MLTFTNILNSLQDGPALASTKINHGFWETCLEIVKVKKLAPEWTDQEIDLHLGKAFFLEGGFCDELLEMLRSWPSNNPEIQLDCTSNAFPFDDRLAPLPPTPRREIDALIKKICPHTIQCGDGMLWKKAVIDGSLRQLFFRLADKRVVLIGPQHLQPHIEVWGWTDCHFIEIPLRKARATREIILAQIRKALDTDKENVVLLQAGSLATWFVRRLLGSAPRLWLLDMGRALDVIDPQVVLGQAWGAAYASAIATHYGTSSPKWRTWLGRKRIIVPQHLPTMPDSSTFPIGFSESKSPDMGLLEQPLFTDPCGSYWPPPASATDSLEQTIAADLELPGDRTVVTTSSYTAALWVAAATESLKNGRALRWVVSSYSSPSSRLGPLSDAIVADCDESGMLDLAALKRIPLDSYDGILVTDLFGRGRLDGYCDFADQHEKRLVIDGAAAYDRDFHTNSKTTTAISFQHTNPWGVGEGGCILLDKCDREIAKSLCNFGVRLPKWTHPYAGNFKLSDEAAALITQRLLTRDWWQLRYRLQYKRLEQIANEVNLPVLASAAAMFPGNQVATPAHLAVLLTEPISQFELDNLTLPFATRKYYQPLVTTPEAIRLFERIVCIPVHCGMAALARQVVKAAFCKLLEKREKANVSNTDHRNAPLRHHLVS